MTTRQYARLDALAIVELWNKLVFEIRAERTCSAHPPTAASCRFCCKSRLRQVTNR